MITTEISILVNRKDDIDLIKKNIIDSEIQFPVYIMEYEFHYQIRFKSDYEEWELDKKILDYFSEHEFTTDLEKGRKEIRLQISRTQSGSDGWGRPIEDPLNETKYLIRKSTTRPERFSPKVKVLFKNQEQNYYINIVRAMIPQTGERGFLLVNDFKFQNESFENAIKNHLYKSAIDAFNFGYHKMQNIVDKDFEEYLEFQKKERTKLYKMPRKIIRDFIESCNRSDLEGIIKNVDENILFEKRIRWKSIEIIEGLDSLKEYFLSQSQELLGRNFKIRSSWRLQLPIIEIGVKYYPGLNDGDEKGVLKYKDITFVLNKDKITRITENE